MMQMRFQDDSDIHEELALVPTWPPVLRRPTPKQESL